MSTATPAKSVNKRGKKRTVSNNKEKKNPTSKYVIAEDEASESITVAAPSTLSSAKESALNDPAIVAAGRPRRQPLSKKSSLSYMASPDKFDADKEEVGAKKAAKTVASEKSAVAVVPKAPRAMRKSRPSHQHSKSIQSTTNQEDESVVCAPKGPPKKDKAAFPTAATPPRFQEAAKSRRERATSHLAKANESLESQEGQEEDNTKEVRFQTDSVRGLAVSETMSE
jgi:hypothetical protein